ncbi:MAG: hypothetical protein HY505_01175 [Candidatus Yanofskybacteria bacterium]|nr:hypothetical protein [Candidatus Yanofskybacteria bacterium]
MRKILAFVVVFAFLASIVPVQAQGVGIMGGGYRPSSWEGWWYYLQGDQVHMLQADQIDFVRRSMNMGRNAQFRRVTDNLVPYGDYVGLRNGRDFYPLYQCGKGQRIVRAASTMAITTTVGVLLGGKRGAGYGAVIGGAYAAHKDTQCWGVQNKNVQVVGLESDGAMVVQPPSQAPTGLPVQAGRENGWNQRLRQQQTGSAYQRGVVDGRPVNNRTGLDVLLWVEESDVAIEISRGGHVQVSRNPRGMEAETVETAPGGREVRRSALVIPNHDLDGWDIVVPAGR